MGWVNIRHDHTGAVIIILKATDDNRLDIYSVCPITMYTKKGNYTEAWRNAPFDLYICVEQSVQICDGSRWPFVWLYSRLFIQIRRLAQFICLTSRLVIWFEKYARHHLYVDVTSCNLIREIQSTPFIFYLDAVSGSVRYAGVDRFL